MLISMVAGDTVSCKAITLSKFLHLSHCASLNVSQLSSSSILQVPDPKTSTESISFCDHHSLNDVISSNKLITSYVRIGDLQSAFTLFSQMPVKTTRTWNSMLAGYAKMNGKTKEAQELFEKIPERDTVSYNTMLACFVHNSDMDTATGFFDRIPVKDTASWNTLISGFALNGNIEKAHELFMIMPNKNSVTWNAIISGYVECGNLDAAVKLFEAAPSKSIIAWTAIITGSMRLGRIGEAERLFSEMPEKSLITWNAMVAGYVQNFRSEDGLKLFKKMLGCGIKPNPVSLTSVLLGCSELTALQCGKQVHQLTCKLPLNGNTTACTCLASMYWKCGDLDDALKLFLEIPVRDIVSWNAMICGFAQHGEGEKALRLFEEMRKKGVRPDWITFVGIMLACGHSGLTNLGIKYFNSMWTDFGVEAKPDHYACMIDLLGRAGKLNAAMDLIKKMPFKPHAAIFGSLLGASRVHKNIEIAELAANNLLDLDPTCAIGYVQLANVYAAKNRWDRVATIWHSMRSSKIMKPPGCSWVEIEHVVHEFRSGDTFHLELPSIRERLNELEKRLKSAGYVPGHEFALHDVEVKQKEQLLLWHSEKLAIAYALTKLPSTSPILVFENLRMCGDCHLYIKFVSAVERRKVIVRDTAMFHHFQDGACSCGDYW